jgi:hypothetical protein
MAIKVEVVSVRLINCGIHFSAVYWEPLGLISHLYCLFTKRKKNGLPFYLVFELYVSYCRAFLDREELTKFHGRLSIKCQIESRINGQPNKREWSQVERSWRGSLCLWSSFVYSSWPLLLPHSKLFYLSTLFFFFVDIPLLCPLERVDCCRLSSEKTQGKKYQLQEKS